MSQAAITVENVSKSFFLKHQQKESYTTLRDTIANKAKNLFSGKIGNNSMEEFWALKDISFTINEGERVGIIGRNGAGKSTLLKVLSRIITPNKGRIVLEGRVASLLEVGTGFHPELSGRENIFLNGSILGMTKSEIQSKFDEIVAFSEVEKFLDTPVKRYSSGMYVRLAFAVAAHLEPEILIVDEVLAVGDAEFQKKCIGKMKDVSGQGRTVLFVSHNMAAIQNLCNKAIVLKNGKVDFPMSEINSALKHYMKSVNQLATTNLKDRKDRQGEGKLKVVSFQFLNEHNEIQSELICGQKVQFKIDFEQIDPKLNNNITCGIAIYGEDGNFYTLLSNDYSGKPFDILSSKGSFVCTIQKFPLVAGKYMLNLSIYQNNIMQDWIQEAVVFDVEDGDFYGTGKIVPGSHRSILIENSWNLI